MKHRNQQRLAHNENVDFKPALEAVLQDYNIRPLNEKQMAQLVAHYEMMIVWNRHTNLTRIVNPQDAARLHYGESLFGARFVGEAKKVLDIGSGAGFPAIPLAVMLSDVEITALEANQKKALFLQEAKEALKLENFRVARARVEAFDLGEFDLLTSRALDRAEDVMPQVLKKMRAPQRLMLYCAPDMVDHLKNHISEEYKIEVHKIPESQSRLIAIFSPA
jgi:16S rRNA (guanine527-N7)-methyltransferase